MSDPGVRVEAIRAVCPEHGTPYVNEPLTRSDGTQIGTLTIDCCPRCEAEAEEGFEGFLERVMRGEFDD